MCSSTIGCKTSIRQTEQLVLAGVGCKSSFGRSGWPAIIETRERAGEPGVLRAVACEVPVGPEGLVYPRVFRYGVPGEDPAVA